MANARTTNWNLFCQSSFLAVLGVILVGLPSTYAATYSAFGDLPKIGYDFVIVGGGTAGNVIANRLTENPKFQVLVVEGGGDNVGVLNSIVPGFAFHLANTAFDWNYTTTAQKGLGGTVLPYPRGHGLGGSSSINGMFYTRGSSSDFDRFARVTGDNGWSWDNLQPYIRKNEKWTAPTDHHNTTGQFNPAVHGFHGINSVSLEGVPRPVTARVLQTTKDFPEEFPFNLDMNSGNPLGVTFIQSTIGGGKRSSSATSYLGPEFRSRKNLHILLNTRVTRILQDSKGSKPSFRTVEFTTATGPVTGQSHRLTATKEVILSAGSIGTPHVLLNSGFGDPADLSKLGIKTLVNLPSVGRNLSDQPQSTAIFLSTSSDPLDLLNSNTTLIDEAFAEWNKSHTGPLGDFGPPNIVWTRLPDNSPIFQKFPDPSPGRNSPHIELVVTTSGAIADGVPTHFAIGSVVGLTPVSRGSVRLASANPLDAPLIDPAFLESEFDIFVVREAIKTAQRFFSGPAWTGFVLGPVGGLENATTDDQLDEYIRGSTITSAHPVGTAAMSARNASFGVVDPDLLVKGVKGLRIVDASIMPFVTCGHTQAPVYILAERAADLIKEAWQ